MSPTMPSNMSNILDRLPLELQIEVYKQLDSYSIISLLRALPELVSDFTVVSDLPQECDLIPLFFKIPGIKIVRLDECHPLMRARGHILTLYELVNVRFTHLGELHIPYLHFNLPSLDSDCFIYARTLFGGESLGNSVEKLTQSKSSKVILDFKTDLFSREDSPRYDYVCRLRDHPTRTRRTKGSFYKSFGAPRVSYLQSVDVHGVNSIKCLMFDHLHTLTVHFGTSGGSSQFSKASIAKINLPVHFESFTIYYEDEFPVIKDIQIYRQQRQKSYLYPVSCKFFGIIHEPSSTIHYCTEYYDCKLPENAYDIDLSFTCHFKNIHIVGGLNYLVDKVDFSCCEEFYWKQTGNIQDRVMDQEPDENDDLDSTFISFYKHIHTMSGSVKKVDFRSCNDLHWTSNGHIRRKVESVDIDHVFDLGHVTQFTFETTLSKPKLPKIKLEYNNYMESVSILWYYPELDFNGMWDGILLGGLNKLGFWCYDSQYSPNPSNGHTVIPDNLFFHTNFITLRGVELDSTISRVGRPFRMRRPFSDMGRMKGPFAELDNAVNGRIWNINNDQIRDQIRDELLRAEDLYWL